MSNIKLTIAAGLLLGSTALMAAIAGSPHDLSVDTGDASGLASLTTDNGELCVYCHTPHAGNSTFSAGGNAPLWNKTPDAAGTGSVTTTSTFTMYGASAANTAGTTIASTATASVPSNPSLACLSCHDGVSSIDSIVNSPGAGTIAEATPRLITAVGGNDNANIGIDLTNDHPISIVYGGTGTGNTYSGGPASLRPKDANLETVTGSAWLGATTIQDLLRGADMVECGSCHDPHNGDASAAGTRATEVNFLRVSNVGSKLCLGCHDK